MYTYFKEIKIEEHLLYAEEIARIKGIYTTKGNPHALFISAVLKEYSQQIQEYEQLYYLDSRNNKNKVYSLDFYEKAFDNICSKIVEKYKFDKVEEIFLFPYLEIKVADKNYKFVIKDI